MEYIFTENWFRYTPDFMERILSSLPSRRHFLEIGSYEGRSTVWFVENALMDDGSIWCLDTWGEEEDEQILIDMKKIEETFDHNTHLVMKNHPKKNVIKQKGVSRTLLAQHLSCGECPRFDFVYIDGSHKAIDVLSDAIMSFWLTKPGGVILFDDYLWTNADKSLDRPGPAIDAFLRLFEGRIEVIQKKYQVGVRKLG